MPELVEVELSRRWLQARSAGRVVVRVEALDPGLDLLPLTGARLGDWWRHGKQLGVPFTPPAPWPQHPRAAELGERPQLLAHLGMTGRWALATAVERHARLRLALDDGATLSFIDPRRFGEARLGSASNAEALRARLGPDAWDLPPDGPALSRAFGRSRVPLHHALMDQRRLAGLGNIAAAEVAYRAGVDPARPGDTLTVGEWARVARAIADHLAFVFDAESGEEVVYLTAGGANPFLVYGRAVCPGCSTALVRRVARGRSITLCPALCRAPEPRVASA